MYDIVPAGWHLYWVLLFILSPDRLCPRPPDPIEFFARVYAACLTTYLPSSTPVEH